MGRIIDEVIVHCSATKPSMDIGVKEINEWHLNRGWSGIGYHFVIRRNGKIEPGRPTNLVGAHCKGRNKHSIGVCLVGGINERGEAEFNYTSKQIVTLTYFLVSEKILGRKISGHNQYSSKACPCFNVPAFASNI